MFIVNVRTKFWSQQGVQMAKIEDQGNWSRLTLHLIQATIPANPVLRFCMDTLGWMDIVNTYTDVPHFDIHIIRTVVHFVPLQKIMWEEWVED